MSPATLVERLRPKHMADEPLARAVVSDDYAERRASVSAYLVANNALKSEAAASIEALAAERDALRAAMEKIDAIRNSIIGFQNIGWSEHIYPLVAALQEAGFEGVGYEKARESVRTLMAAEARAETAEASLADAVKAENEACARLVENFIDVRPAFMTEDEGGLKFETPAAAWPIYSPGRVVAAIRSRQTLETGAGK